MCNCLERHRLILLYLRERTDLFTGRRKKMLHLAPEPQLARLFQNADSIQYLTADLFNPRAMVKMDVTDIQYPDNTFDIIYCSHVLEHVTDDSRAMAELFRVLKPGGWAILQVPISGEITLEDPTVLLPGDRERLFGKDDHVRTYGLDYADRLRVAGFKVKVDGFVRELGTRVQERYGLMKTEDVYYCEKMKGRREPPRP